MKAFHVKEINSSLELAGLKSIWADLLAGTAGGTFFQSHAWLTTYWEFFGERKQLRDSIALETSSKTDAQQSEIALQSTSGRQDRLRVLLVEADGEPIGILPLVVATEPYRIGPIRVLGYPLAGWGSFYGPIGPHPTATLQTGLDYIHSTPRDWDLLDLRWIDDEVDRGATSQAMQATGFNFERAVWHESAQIELEHGWEKYRSDRKSTWRNNVRRCERLLEQRGVLRYVRFRPEANAKRDINPRWDLYDTCVKLAERSWQGSSTSGTTLSHPAVKDYLRAAHKTAVEAGAADLNLLLLNEQPVAFAYNYCYRGWVYGVRSGYDPIGGQEGAGTVLMAKMIEDSCRRGDRLIDLGPNYFEPKRYWYTRLQPAYHYTHFHPARLRAQALRLKRVVRRWLHLSQPAPEPVALQSSTDYNPQQ